MIKKYLLKLWFRCCGIRMVAHTDLSVICGGAIYVSNHVSYLDALVLRAFLPSDTIIALPEGEYTRKWNRLFIGKNMVQFDLTNPQAVKKIVSLFNDGKKIVIFPEGRVTDNNNIMKLYDVACSVIEMTGARVYPIWIDGLQYGKYSETSLCLPNYRCPKTIITVWPETALCEDRNEHACHLSISTQLYDLMQKTYVQSVFNPRSCMFERVLRAGKRYGWSRKIMMDIQKKPYSYKDLLIQSYVLGRYITTHTGNDENIGLMLPNTVANISCFLGIELYDKIPVMINFSAGASLILSMCKTAVVKHVITSKTFVMKANLQPVVDELLNNGIHVLYLEDIAKHISLGTKLKGVLSYLFKSVPTTKRGDSPAVILFTSGSEGTPKAVVLSHNNLISNLIQTSTFEHLNLNDLMFNSLPMFHSMGLSVGCFFPLLQGARTFLFPTPLQYKAISELLYQLNATVMLATDTFYRMYAKIAHPDDFRTIRLCYAGAEAVKNETRKQVLEKLGLRLMEAYGATECSPVICCNNSIYNKFGTLGRLTPCTEYKLIHVDGMDDNSGELCVRGPNVMLGYMFSNNPGVLVPVVDGWYSTGDVVEIDMMGFVKMRDRIKRFAKVGGEMVSLTLVENIAKSIFESDDNFVCAAVAVPHSRKGEQIVLVSNADKPFGTEFLNAINLYGYSSLSVPAVFLKRDDIPVLGSGKIDFLGLKKWVVDQLEKIN